MYLSSSNLMGFLKFAGTVKIRAYDTFSKCKSWGGGYCVSNCSPLKMSSRTHLLRGLHMLS